MKECPRCHALLFEDMDVCYDCLYSFRYRHVGDMAMPLSLDDIEEADPPALALGPSPARAMPMPAPASAGEADALEGDAASPSPAASVNTGYTDALGEDTVFSPRAAAAGAGKPWAAEGCSRRVRSVTIGRARTNDVVLSAPNVSRRHARVIFNDEGIFLEDLDSTNGVRLNGVRFEGTGKVKVGDRLGIGNATLEVMPDEVVVICRSGVAVPARQGA